MQNARKQRRTFLEKPRARTRADHYLSAGVPKTFNSLILPPLASQTSGVSWNKEAREHIY